MSLAMNKTGEHSIKSKRTQRISVAVIILIVFFSIASGVDGKHYSGGDEMGTAGEPIVVAFPLKGEWLAPNTPGTKIPSHGTNQLGTRYAYDFVQVDWNRTGWPAYRASFLRYLFSGIPLDQYFCWGQEVYSPCDGVVVQAQDGYAENSKTNLFLDTVNAYKNAHYFNPETDDIQSVAGNYIIIDCGSNVYAALVHLQTGSIQVSVGQSVKTGDVIGRVGHSGNSYAPHLHFQIMDSSDITVANGLPCAFKEYEVFQNGNWIKVADGIPTSKDRIRFQQSDTETE